MRKADTHFFKRPVVKGGLVAVTLCLIVLAAVCTRVLYGSMKAYHQGKLYLDEHEYIRAITFFDRSIHWYTPFNPYVYQSAQHLWEIGLRAEQDGDIRLALIAMRTIRRGFYAARSFYTPGKDWISRCNVKIASLTSKESKQQKLEGKVSTPPASLQDPAPDILWTCILEVGFLGWITSVIGFLAHALTGWKDLKLKSRPTILWGVMITVFYALWLIGMMRA